jgi:hypothetical protein
MLATVKKMVLATVKKMVHTNNMSLNSLALD